MLSLKPLNLYNKNIIFFTKNRASTDLFDYIKYDIKLYKTVECVGLVNSSLRKVI
jgi:hypothetical protein